MSSVHEGMMSSSGTLVPAYTIDPSAAAFTLEKAVGVVDALAQASDRGYDPRLHSQYAAIRSDFLILKTGIEESRFHNAKSGNYLRDLDATIALFESNYEYFKQCATTVEPWTDDQYAMLTDWTTVTGIGQDGSSLKAQVRSLKVDLGFIIDTRMILLDPSLLDEAPTTLSPKLLVLKTLPTREDVNLLRWDLSRRSERNRRLKGHSFGWPDSLDLASVEPIPDSFVPSCNEQLHEYADSDHPGPTTPQLLDMEEVLDILPDIRSRLALNHLSSVIESFLTVDVDKHDATKTSRTERRRRLLLSAWSGQAGT